MSESFSICSSRQSEDHLPVLEDIIKFVERASHARSKALFHSGVRNRDLI